MPKRIGFVWEEVVSIENCEKAILNALKNKRKTRYLLHIRQNYQKYAEQLRDMLINGWEPGEIRCKTINEGTNKKTRNLKIPPLRDHFAHTAVAQVLGKYLAPKFYFYACGSIPKRGQIFAKRAVEKMLKKRPGYAAQCDVKKFYETLTADTVMHELGKVFKDKKFLDINRKILKQMGNVVAIGFTVSHWYAHLALMRVDSAIKQHHANIGLVRSMDNFILLSNSKVELHRAIRRMQEVLDGLSLRMKNDWQVFPLQSRMIEFLSYRHAYGKTILRKSLMYRIARRLRKLKPCARTARIIMSYHGIMKHCDSHNFKRKYFYPYIDFRICKRLISESDKKRIALCGI